MTRAYLIFRITEYFSLITVFVCLGLMVQLHQSNLRNEMQSVHCMKYHDCMVNAPPQLTGVYNSCP